MKLEVGKIIDAIKQLTEDEANELIESMRIHAEELKKAEPRTKDVWVVWYLTHLDDYKFDVVEREWKAEDTAFFEVKEIVTVLQVKKVTLTESMTIQKGKSDEAVNNDR